MVGGETARETLRCIFKVVGLGLSSREGFNTVAGR